MKPGSTVTVVASQPGKPSVSCTFVASAQTTGCALPFLSDGTWTISASSVDPAGNQSPSSAPLSIFLDTAPPPPPPTPVIPSKADTPALGPIQDLGGDNRPIVGVDGGTPGDVITVIATNGTDTITCSFVVGEATRCQLPSLGAGDWTITATATDPASNVSRPSGSIAVHVAGQKQAEVTRPAAKRGRPVLRLTATTSRRVLHPRDRTVITVRARNVSRVTARRVVLRVNIPAGLAVVGQRSLALVHGRVSFTVGTLADGRTASRQVIVVATRDGVGTQPAVRAHLSATLATPRDAALIHRIVASVATGGAPVTG